MIFTDTGAWFASVVPDDEDYEKAVAWLTQNREPLITTDYIVDETLTLLKARGEKERALEIGELFFDGSLALLRYLSPGEISKAWQVFKTYSDKGWSFTDCTSKVVMEQFEITHAFAFDKHFRQFGTIVVVPSESEN